jgi:hypothetical protein
LFLQEAVRGADIIGRVAERDNPDNCRAPRPGPTLAFAGQRGRRGLLPTDRQGGEVYDDDDAAAADDDDDDEEEEEEDVYDDDDDDDDDNHNSNDDEMMTTTTTTTGVMEA